MKNVADRYTFDQLPRDGHALFLKADAKEEFMAHAVNAAYILIPSTYWPMIAKWSQDDRRIKLAQFTEDNVAGGFMGTVCDVDMFSDINASTIELYPRGAPVLFGQFTGQFVRDLEYQRCPYFRLYVDLGNRRPDQWKPAGDATLEQMLLHAKSSALGKMQSITVPARYLQTFSDSLHAQGQDFYRAEIAPMPWGNGIVGLWNRSIYVYTDAHLHPSLINPEHEIAFHYVAYDYNRNFTVEEIAQGVYLEDVLEIATAQSLKNYL